MCETPCGNVMSNSAPWSYNSDLLLYNLFLREPEPLQQGQNWEQKEQE